MFFMFIIDQRVGKQGIGGPIFKASDWQAVNQIDWNLHPCIGQRCINIYTNLYSQTLKAVVLRAFYFCLLLMHFYW